VGYQWLNAGYHKVTDPNGVWVGAKAGAGLTGFANGALKLPVVNILPFKGGMRTSSRMWCFPMPQCLATWSALGNVLVGIGLIVGGLTGAGHLLRGLDEYQLLVGWDGQHQSYVGNSFGDFDPRMAQRRLVWSRSLVVAHRWDALAARFGVRARWEGRRKPEL
jgi:hypothetical protein